MLSIYDVTKKVENKEYKEGRLIDPCFQGDLYEAIKNTLQHRSELENSNKVATVIFNKAYARKRGEGYMAIIDEVNELISFIDKLFI